MKVGGSIWEFKIDPKRFREEIKNDIGKIRKKIDEKRASRVRRHLGTWISSTVSRIRRVRNARKPARRSSDHLEKLFIYSLID